MLQNTKHYIFPMFSSSSSLILHFVANSKRMSLRVQECMQELSQYNKLKPKGPNFVSRNESFVYILSFTNGKHSVDKYLAGSFNVCHFSVLMWLLSVTHFHILFSYCSSCTLENMITNLEKFNFFSI